MKALKIFGLFLFVLVNWEASAQCTPPTVYQVYTYDPTICGTNGYTWIGINSSQIGITYQLFKDGVASGVSKSGTGAQVFWYNITETGVYTAKATSSPGCIVDMSGNATIVRKTPPQIFNVTGGGLVQCGNISIGLSGSEVGIYYQLIGNGVAANQWGTGGPLTFSGITAPANYYIIAKLTATDNTCFKQMNGTVGVSDQPVKIFNPIGQQIDVVCQMHPGDYLEYTFTDSGIASYSWSVSSGGQIVNNNGNAIIVNWPQTGDYTVSVNYQTANGCSSSISYGVHVNPTPVLSAVSTSNTVCTAPFNGGINLTVSNLLGTADYAWYQGSSNTLLYTNEDVTANQGGQYNVLVTDSQTGCSWSEGYYVDNEEAPPSVSEYYVDSDFFCPGSPVNLNLELEPLTAGPFWIVYSDGTTDYTVNNVLNNKAVISVSPANTTTYFIKSIYDVVTRCTTTADPSTFTYAINSVKPTPFVVGGGGPYCSGGTGVSITLPNTQNSMVYQLKRGSTLVGAPLDGADGTPLSWDNITTAGTYTIVATQPDYNCTQTMTGSAVVTVISLPSSFTTSGTSTICSGETTATVNLSGSTTTISYQLLLGGVAQGFAKTGTGLALSWTGLTSAGTYTVVATTPLANCTRTMSGSAVITVNTTPANFTLTGGGTICSGATGPSFTLGGSETGVSYQLKVNGSTNSGSAVNGSGNPIVWTNKIVAGPYTVVATRTGCIAKTMPGNPSVIVNPLPTLFAVGGTGSFCTGGAGLPVTLSNSDNGVNYQLKRGTTLVGTPMLGNAAALSFPNQTTAGTYTIAATNPTTTCTRTMTGSAVITVNALPTAYTVGGAGAVCAGSGRTLTLSNSQAGVNYQLIMGGNNIGPPIPGIPGALSWLNQGAAGTYTVLATNSTTSCTRTMTGSAAITINPLPNLFSVTGGNVCGAAFIVIGLSGSESGANFKYQLKLNGVNQGTSKTGTGASLSWGSLAGTGVYTIVATNTTTTCVQVMTGSATLYLRPVAFSITGGGVFCTGGSPIPVQLAGSETGVNYQLKLNGVDDEAPLAGSNGTLTWLRQAVGNYTIVATNTSTNCTQNMTGQVTITEVTVVAPVSGPGSVSSGSSVTLSTPTLAGYTYQWKQDGDVLSSETASSLSVSQSGNYQVVVSSSGCSATSDIHYVQVSVKPYYNGLITSMRWRTAKPYVVTGGDLQGMYSFDYDEKYQLKEAQFYNINPVLGTFAVAGNQLRESNLSYDPNGNIKTLQRFDATGSRTHNFAYAYNANATATTQLNNQLNTIPGYSSYSYNAIGQLTGEDKTTGDDQYVKYDVTGKVTKVFSDADTTHIKVEYKYDDRGFRLSKKNHVTNRTTWYLRDANGNILSVFEEDNTSGAFNETEVPIYGSGKLGTYYPDPDQIGSTAYELTDHLGNVRAIVKEKHNVYTATIEDTNVEDISNPRVQEMQYFQNLFETEVTDFRLNHTAPTPGLVDNPNKLAYLYWNDNVGTQASNKAIGPAIALKVDVGDQVSMETFARYEHQPNFTRNVDLAILSALLGNTFVGTLNMDNLPAISNMMQNGLTAGGFAGTGTDPTRPYAYLNYMLFNESLQFVDGGAWRVSTAAAFLPGEEGDPTRLHEKLAFPGPLTVSQKGFVYVWVSNESKNAKVWFDDLKVTHVQGIVTQGTDYYPYGSVARELKTPEDAVYRFGYQGQFAEKDAETGWNHFELREYDALTGRWQSMDPARQFYSPYIGMGNNPIKGVDSDGGSVDDFYIYSDGTIEYVKTGNVDNFYYVTEDNNIITLAQGWQRNNNGLIQLPSTFCFDGEGISFGFKIKEGNLDRAFVNPQAMAAMFGAFAETGYTDFTINQFSYANGGSPDPSISHINGMNGDFRYLRTDASGAKVLVFDGAFDMTRNSAFTEALYKFGYTDLKSYYVPAPSLNMGILPRTSHLNNHDNHLHLQGFKPRIQCTDFPSIIPGPR